MITKPILGDILKTCGILLIPMIIVNGLLYYLGNSMGAFTDSIVTPQGQPITIAAVIIATTVGAVLCTLFFLIIRLLASNLVKWSRITGYALLILSFANPFAIENYNILTILVLNAMHVVIAVPFIIAFVKLSRRAVLKTPKK